LDGVTHGEVEFEGERIVGVALDTLRPSRVGSWQDFVSQQT
jgi:hypothetical protein